MKVHCSRLNFSLCHCSQSQARRGTTRRLEVPREGGCGEEGLGSGRGICRGKGRLVG
uniref:Uncharacterized protein n=1 Tax=Solanum lycopersicum TaxID=4081 RepID=K4BI13_SOLLC